MLTILQCLKWTKKEREREVEREKKNLCPRDRKGRGCGEGERENEDIGDGKIFTSQSCFILYVTWIQPWTALSVGDRNVYYEQPCHLWK